MASITIRDVPDAVQRALQNRAARHGRSAEAEIREILRQAAQPEGRQTLGSLLTSIATDAGALTDAEVEQINELRDRTPKEPMRFE